MRILLLAAAFAGGLISLAHAQGRGFSYGTGSNSGSHYVSPHYNSSGGYVGGHYRTNPDSSRSNNYGSYGNYNSHNGGIGNGYGRSAPRF
jgi:hypothetical protein